MQNIHTKEGLLEELNRINIEYREAYNKLTLEGSRMPISQFKRLEGELFNNWKDEVFDTVHATCAFEVTQ